MTKRNVRVLTSRNRKSTQPDFLIAPEAVLEAVHDLMHWFDPENHSYFRAPLSDGAPARGLRFHPSLSTVGGHKSFGFFGCGQDFAELSVLTTGDCREHFSLTVLEQFEYSNPRLLHAVSQALASVNVHVPETLEDEIDELQRSLAKSGR